MKLIIKNTELSDNKIYVDCITEIGNFKGIWMSNNVPIKDKEYFTELTIIKYCVDISCVNNKCSSVSVCVKNGIVQFVGYCEDMDDEVYYIRLNNDWLEMVDFTDNESEIKNGDFVSFSANSDCILIYPY